MTASRRIPWGRIGMPAVIVALAIVFGSINPNFWSVTNLTNVSRQMSILAFLSLGQGLQLAVLFVRERDGYVLVPHAFLCVRKRSVRPAHGAWIAVYSKGSNKH